MANRKNHALVALPVAASIALTQADNSNWLRRSRLRAAAGDGSLLAALGAEFDLPVPAAGLAALRLWGQTGQRPEGWMCGADPVWLQAGLDKLYVQVPPADDLDADGLQAMFRQLQQDLFADDAMRLQANAEFGYLHSVEPFATATIPAATIAGERPDAYMPSGAGVESYLRLTGEIQLALHEHPYNQLREQQGRQPLNSLWLWGGGEAAEATPRPMPALFSSDPLLHGYWLQSAAEGREVPAALSDCLQLARNELIIDLQNDPRPLEAALLELRAIMEGGQLQQLTLLCADRTCIDSRPGDRFKIWRRPADPIAKEPE
jgi:hypothetical protein